MTPSHAALDRILALLVLALAGTGLASLWAGAPRDAWLFALHGILAGTLTVAVAIKLRRSVPRALAGRRRGRLVLGLVVSLVAIAALTGGFAWVATGQLLWVDVPGIGRWTVLTLHAWAGLVLVPLLAFHLLPRRWLLLRPGAPIVPRARRRLLSRRSLLAGIALGTTGAAAWVAANVAEALRGGSRRFTGSRWLAAGGIPIPTTFLGEGTPAIDTAGWRLHVGAHAWTLADLRALGEETATAVLDCTSGWAIETSWTGVALSRVLAASGLGPLPSERIEVRSVTGWSTALAPADARRCLLAWAVAGRSLPAANGAPLRLVAPDRRGLEWVKWVAEIRVA